MSYVASGITGASPIWQKIMRYALKGINIPGIPIPDGIEGASVCSDSGTAPAADNPCPTRYEYFIKGTIPTESGLTKKDLAINRTTHHPPNNDTEAGDVTTENHTVAADPFIKNYCVDCQPYPDGYQEPAITIPYNEN
jgi:membrane carboxypeptidase/penicillin-binding protein